MESNFFFLLPDFDDEIQIKENISLSYFISNIVIPFNSTTDEFYHFVQNRNRCFSIEYEGKDMLYDCFNIEISLLTCEFSSFSVFWKQSSNPAFKSRVMTI